MNKGDKVVCIEAGPVGTYRGDGELPPLRVGAEYTIQGATQCECGHETVDVGLASPNGVVCCDCGATRSSPKAIWWVSATRFAKVQSREEAIAEAIKNEDYETVAKLTKGDEEK